MIQKHLEYMDKKQLYKRKVSFVVNGKESVSLTSKLHYGVIPKSESIYTENFDKAYEFAGDMGFPLCRCETLFRKKPYFYIITDGHSECSFNKRNFKYMQEVIEYEIVVDSYCSFKELSDELPVDEFLDYLKDKGVGGALLYDGR